MSESAVVLMFFSTFVVAFWLGRWWTKRVIDHRWFCGESHVACAPCRPLADGSWMMIRYPSSRHRRPEA